MLSTVFKRIPSDLQGALVGESRIVIGSSPPEAAAGSSEIGCPCHLLTFVWLGLKD